jgi:hypothetical protein
LTTPTNITVRDIVKDNGLIRNDLLRIGLLFDKTDSTAETWLNTEYTADVHIVLHLYITLKSILQDTSAVMQLLYLVIPNVHRISDKINNTTDQSLLLIGDNRYINHPGLTESWWDMWMNTYVEQPRLLITTAVNLREIASRPLPF